MAPIMLSLKPVFAEAILSGKKSFEFRKVRPARPVSKILIYETAPVRAVTGEAEVLEVIEGTPDELIAAAGGAAGVSREFLEDYYRGRKTGVAYRLGKAVRHPEPVPLPFAGIGRAPQSFAYARGKGRA